MSFPKAKDMPLVQLPCSLSALVLDRLLLVFVTFLPGLPCGPLCMVQRTAGWARGGDKCFPFFSSCVFEVISNILPLIHLEVNVGGVLADK